MSANQQENVSSSTAVSIESLAEPIKEEIVTQEIKPVYTPVSSFDTDIETGVLVREVEEPLMSDEDIKLIALVTMAEAEGESETGKRLVIDTILNRVDSEDAYYPDTVSEVVYQKGQFSSMWNGRVDRCYVNEDICQLVREELENRTNSEVMYFHAGKYSKYGTPMFAEGNHYFSSI